MGRRTGKHKVILTERASSALMTYEWPGNIRELRNALERAMILGGDGELDLQHLPAELRARTSTRSPARAHPSDVSHLPPARASLDDVQRDAIRRALEECGGNRTWAAKRLGISRSTLKRKLLAIAKSR